MADGGKLWLLGFETPKLPNLARIVYRIGCLPFKQGDVGSNPTASTIQNERCSTMGYTTKVKKRAQTAGIASGWNQHVDKYTKQKANKVIRRFLKKDAIKEQNCG